MSHYTVDLKMNVDFKDTLLKSGVRENVVQTLEQDEVSLPPNFINL
jgi:hypothetical protein